MKHAASAFVLTMPLAFTSCTAVPTGPTVLVLQGSGKTFAQFGTDDTVCRKFAALQAQGVAPDQAALRSGLVGSRADVGVVPVSERTEGYGETPQDLYNIAYIQCMYEQGHRVPVPGHVLFEDRLGIYPPPPPPPSEQRPVP